MSKKTRVILAIALAAAGAALYGLRADLPFLPGPRRPNVLFLVIDSLRHDRVAPFGGPGGMIPSLESLADQCIVYDRAYAPSSWTAPSVASFFLGQYPSQHRITRFFAGIPRRATPLAQILSGRGYATSVVSANAAIPKLSFGRGFERYEIVGKPTLLNPKSDGFLVNETALRFVDEVGRRRPHFLYLHYMETHAPYRNHDGNRVPPPPGVARTDEVLNLGVLTGGWEKEESVRRERWTFTAAEVQRLEQLYDQEVRYLDGVLAELFRGLKERGFLDDAIVIVTADHGEEFGEHGAYYHGVSLFEAAIRVPLWVCLPERRRARISRPVELGGLAAMVLGRLGVERPASFTVPPVPVEGGGENGRYAHSELLESQIQIRLHERAIMSAAEKLLVAGDGRQVGYDLGAGLVERPRRSAPAATLVAALADFRVALAGGGQDAAQTEMDAATLERLRAVGYFPEK
jgi:arylsulfatase A-like enzyme